MAELDDSPPPGKQPEITLEERTWLVSRPAKRPRTWYTCTNSGPRGCWPAVSETMLRPREQRGWNEPGMAQRGVATLRPHTTGGEAPGFVTIDDAPGLDEAPGSCEPKRPLLLALYGVSSRNQTRA